MENSDEIHECDCGKTSTIIDTLYFMNIKSLKEPEILYYCDDCWREHEEYQQEMKKRILDSEDSRKESIKDLWRDFKENMRKIDIFPVRIAKLKKQLEAHPRWSAGNRSDGTSLLKIHQIKKFWYCCGERLKYFIENGYNEKFYILLDNKEYY
jgi:hypothetical protein